MRTWSYHSGVLRVDTPTGAVEVKGVEIDFDDLPVVMQKLDQLGDAPRWARWVRDTYAVVDHNPEETLHGDGA